MFVNIYIAYENIKRIFMLLYMNYIHYNYFSFTEKVYLYIFK
jgi:hypothetical protein